MKKLSLLLLPLFLAGCATSNALIGELPQIQDPNKAATVVPIRISSIVGLANPYKVAIDGKDIHSIGSGEHSEFLVSEGAHTISVKCFGGWYPTTKVSSVSFMAERNKSYYFEIAPNMKCAGIVQIDESKATELLKKNKKLDLNKH